MDTETVSKIAAAVIGVVGVAVGGVLAWWSGRSNARVQLAGQKDITQATLQAQIEGQRAVARENELRADRRAQVEPVRGAASRWIRLYLNLAEAALAQNEPKIRSALKDLDDAYQGYADYNYLAVPNEKFQAAVAEMAELDRAVQRIVAEYGARRDWAAMGKRLLSFQGRCRRMVHDLEQAAEDYVYPEAAAARAAEARAAVAALANSQGGRALANSREEAALEDAAFIKGARAYRWNSDLSGRRILDLTASPPADGGSAEQPEGARPAE